MKVQAMKNDPSRTFRDLADIQALLELPGVDENEVRGYFQRHGLLARFEISSAPAAGLELSLEVSAADASALRAASAPKRVAPADYARFLAQFSVSQESLRARRGPCGSERFTL